MKEPFNTNQYFNHFLFSDVMIYVVTCQRKSENQSRWTDTEQGGLKFHLFCSTWSLDGMRGLKMILESVRRLLLLLSRFSRVRLCATPEMAAHQAPLSLGFSRQEHWSGLPFPSPMHESEKWKGSRSVVSDSQRPHGLQPTRLLRPWDFPGKSTGVGCHCLVCVRRQEVRNLMGQLFWKF